MKWMILPLRRYATFRGRSRRKEFWTWALFVVAASVLLSFADQALGLGGRVGAGALPAGAGHAAGYAAVDRGGALTGLFGLATIIPNLAVQVRRLHDVGRRGWWLLAPVAPWFVAGFLILGGIAPVGGAVLVTGLCTVAFSLGTAILLLLWFCREGTRGPNRFGEDPKRTGERLRDVFA